MFIEQFTMAMRRDGKRFEPLRFAPYMKPAEGKRREKRIPIEGKDGGDFIVKPGGERVKKDTGWVAEGCDDNGPFQVRHVYEAVEPDGKMQQIRWVDECDNPPPPPWKEDAPPCPIHKEYGLIEKEVKTKYGPAQVHKCPHPECFISCFGSNEERDRFMFVIDRSLHWLFRDKHCPMVCYCGNLLSLKMSKSEKNPERLFFTCRQREGGCKMFMWGDDMAPDRVREHWDWWMSK